jgi:hypothetical protein
MGRIYDTLCEGFTVKHNQNGFVVGFLHYSADQTKNDAWVDEVKKSYPSLDIWRQEMELDFTKASGRRVYPEFKTELHVSRLKPIPYRDIWRGWDFGYHHPACVWLQVTDDDRLHILAELVGTETIIQNFAEEVNALSKKLFYGYEFKDAGDPAVRARSDKNERTTADILRFMGIRIQSKPFLVKDGINLIRTLLIPRHDGFIKLKIDERCQTLVEGFLGQYQRNEEDEPIKDGYYEHIFDALRYAVTLLYDPRNSVVYKPRYAFSRERKTVDMVAGY